MRLRMLGLVAAALALAGCNPRQERGTTSADSAGVTSGETGTMGTGTGTTGAATSGIGTTGSAASGTVGDTARARTDTARARR